MSRKVSNFMKMLMLALCCAMALSIPAYGQGKGKGLGKGRNKIEITRDSTPGIPTSSRGRGRNYYPRTPRGRYIRTSSIIQTRNRNITVPRRVMRGRNTNPGTARGRIS
ncbi:MAG TPA: hypothetical protein VF543_21490 [Pyrinomonadaceae bacterium]|jgi:hypothetical protein